jgi:diaminopimelate decarboxylase
VHRFKYKKGNFYCENIKILTLAKKYQTPFYLYSWNTLVDHFIKLKKSFKEFKPLICFSMKSNSNLSILKILTDKGAGLDIVSGGELYKAKRIKADTKKIVYASVGKTDEEIKEAINSDILLFNVESEPELFNINRIAKRLGKKVKVTLRVNPDIKTGTHSYITTSKKENKFGVTFKKAKDIFRGQNGYKNVSIDGLHLHIGSQITKPGPFKQAISRTVDFINDENLDIEYLNIGGGLGIVYSNEKPQTAKSFAKNIAPILRKVNTKIKLILEPGRFIAGNSAVLVTKVLYIKENPAKIFVIVDAGMSDFIRPCLYNAYHKIIPVRQSKSYFSKKVDIVGPICESADFLGKNRKFKKVKRGHYLAVLGAGAYGYSMASNYNARCKPAEVLVKNNKSYLIRKRQNYKDLVKYDIVADEA